jgi:MFS transporter, DHA1 family, multidrug resistance protein
VYVGLAVTMAVAVMAFDGRPPLVVFVALMAAMLASQALLIPNFNAIAMDPMAAVAGTASSLIGAVQIAVGALLGSLLDRAFDGGVGPLSLGFLAYGLLALVAVLVAERGRLFAPRAEPVPVVPAPPTPEA